jgi:hypothetical protein
MTTAFAVTVVPSVVPKTATSTPGTTSSSDALDTPRSK